MTSSCCSCHHAARTLLRWPPGPSNEAYLSSPHLEASPATTFRVCSSPAPSTVKMQPAHAILSQEPVHTTLSITHHTRKRPSTGPRTTHGPQSPPWWVHWQHLDKVTWEKRKRKETNKKETPTSDQKPNKGKKQDHLKKTSLEPLRQGQWLDTSETNYAQARSASHQTKSSKTTKSSPCTHASSPWTNATPPRRIHANRLKKTEQLHQLSSDRSDRWARSPSTWVPRDVCHPITSWVIWRQAKSLKYPY
jgi:hypothetical protein